MQSLKTQIKTKIRLFGIKRRQGFRQHPSLLKDFWPMELSLDLKSQFRMLLLLVKRDLQQSSMVASG